ncbi:hypothetical protein LINGRAHAP2_LOCUS24413, partial [Linum grandiflorum]
KMGTLDLNYTFVERVHYLTPGQSMANVVVDNEESLSDRVLGHNNSDEGAENSVVGADVCVVHLVDDSDHTSDMEFYQAMDDLGLGNRGECSRCGTLTMALRWTVIETVPHQQAQEEINNNGGEPKEENINDIGIKDLKS